MIFPCCGYVFSNLIRVKPSSCPSCGRKRPKWGRNKRGQVRFYDISILQPGASLILPWDKDKMIYTYEKSQVMRQCVKRQAKSLGWVVECTRHLAGLKV